VQTSRELVDYAQGSPTKWKDRTIDGIDRKENNVAIEIDRPFHSPSKETGAVPSANAKGKRERFGILHEGKLDSISRQVDVNMESRKCVSPFHIYNNSQHVRN